MERVTSGTNRERFRKEALRRSLAIDGYPPPPKDSFFGIEIKKSEQKLNCHYYASPCTCKYEKQKEEKRRERVEREREERESLVFRVFGLVSLPFVSLLQRVNKLGCLGRM
jgi:hypothetical protein